MLSTSEQQTQQLILNLFVSAQSKNRLFNQSNSLVVSPDFLKILLKDATPWSNEKKLTLLKRLASFYKAEPLNTLILGDKDLETPTAPTTLHEIINFIFRMLQDHNEIPMFLSIIKAFLTYYPLTLDHFKQLTQIIGRDYHLEKLSWVRLEMVVRVMKVYYESRRVEREEPMGFFYFYGEESGVKVKCQEARWPFGEHLGFMACFEARKSPKNHRSYLFYIETSESEDETIGLYIENDTLFFEVNRKPTNLLPLKPFTWYPLQFQYNLDHGKLYLSLHDTTIQKHHLPTLPPASTRTITNFIIGKDFYGKINSPTFFASPVPKDETLRTNPYGFETWQSIIQGKSRNLFNNCLFAYFTFSTTETHQKLMCFDPFRKCHGEVMGNTRVFTGEYHRRMIGMYGGLNIILPLFYLGQFYSTNTQLNVLELVTDLVLTPFKLKYLDLEKDSFSSDFFGIFGYLVTAAYDEKYLTRGWVEQLSEWKMMIKQPRVKQEFWLKVLWKVPVWKVKDSGVVGLFYEGVVDSLRKNIAFYQDCFSFTSVLYHTLLYLEESRSSKCCAQHEINETPFPFLFLSPSPSPPPPPSPPPKHLQTILSLLLSNNLRTNYKKALDQIQSLLQLLLTQASPCFYLTLLSLLRGTLQMDEENQGKEQEAAVIVKECNIVPFLFHLGEKTMNHPDVVAGVVDVLMHLAREWKGMVDPDQVAGFVEGLFKKWSENRDTRPKEHIRQDKTEETTKPRRKSESAIRTLHALKLEQQKSQHPPSTSQKIKPQTISSSHLLYSTLKKYHYTQTKPSTKPSSYLHQPTTTPLLVNEQAIRLTLQFYTIASSDLQELILVDFLSELTFSPHNLSFLASSLIFNSFLLTSIIHPSLSPSLHHHPPSPVTYDLALKISSKIISSKISHGKLKDYYTLLLAITQSYHLHPSLIPTLLTESLQRVTKKQDIVETLQQTGLIIFCELKRQEGKEQVQEFWGMIECYLEMVYEECLLKYKLIEQDDFEDKFFPNVLEEPETSPLLSFFTSEHLLPTNNQEELYIVFDNLLSKCQFDSKIQILPILHKHLHTVEIVTSLLQHSILHHLHLHPSPPTPTTLPYHLTILSKLTTLFLALLTNIPKPHIRLEHNVLGRKTLFTTLHFLSTLSQQPLQPDKFTQKRDKLITFVFEYIDYIDRMLGRHTTTASLIKRIEELKKIRYNPYLIELFEFFLRDEKGKHLLTLEHIAEYNNSNKIISENLRTSWEWVFTRPVLLTLNTALSQKDTSLISTLLPSIADKCEEIAFLSATPYSSPTTTTLRHESLKQQRTRLAYITHTENSLRQVVRTWRSLWNLLRIYHHPYGVWMNQRETMDWKDCKNNPMKNFRMKVSKYQTREGIRPILEAKVVEPERIAKGEKHHIIKEETIGLYTTSTSNPTTPSTPGDPAPFKVLWIKQSQHIRGTLSAHPSHLLFTYSSTQPPQPHSFTPFHLPPHLPLHRTYPYTSITNITRKRYLLTHLALELQFNNYTTLLLAFENPQELTRFTDVISKTRKDMYNKNKEAIVMNHVDFCLAEFWWDEPCDNAAKSKVTQEWVQRKITTFNYLLKLNTLAARTYNDYSQYPVFPWVTTGASTPTPTLRNLSLNIGSLGTTERLHLYQTKFSSPDPFISPTTTTPPYHFGTHYSSPGVLFNYLIRLLPFTNCAKQLQGGKFDHPDRMFFSIPSTWDSVTKQMSDVRELIPEFYYLPEMFLNLDGLRLGVMQNGGRVDDVELPQWGGGEAYGFVVRMREILDGEEVGEMVGKWIDLVFGAKQRGKEAEANTNVFYHLTYENRVNLEEIEDEVERNSNEAQIIHFGQTPSQLFQKPHSKRLPLPLPTTTPLHTLFSLKLPSLDFSPSPLALSITSTSLRILSPHHLILYSRKESLCTNRQAIDLDPIKKDKNGLYLVNNDEIVARFFCEGKYWVIGGYLDGSYRVYRVDNGAGITLVAGGKVELGGILTEICISKDSTLLVLGSSLGSLHILELQYSATTLHTHPLHTLHFEHKITHISEHHNLFLITHDSTINLYRFTRTFPYLSSTPSTPTSTIKPVKFFRSWRNKIKVNGCVLVEAPLYAVVVWDNLGVKCYSVNGQLLGVVQTMGSVRGVEVGKSRAGHDVVMVEDGGRLVCLATPGLQRVGEEEVGEGEKVVGWGGAAEREGGGGGGGVVVVQGDVVKVVGLGR